MAGLFSRLIQTLDQTQSDPVAQTNLERISALLLVEIARADHSVDASEQQEIAQALTGSSTLASDEIDQIIAEAMSEADATLSLHSHVSTINARFAKSEKVALVEQMWRVALADGDIDRYEEYTIRKLCDLLHVKHRDYMQAKHRALHKQS